MTNDTTQTKMSGKDWTIGILGGYVALDVFFGLLNGLINILEQ